MKRITWTKPLALILTLALSAVAVSTVSGASELDKCKVALGEQVPVRYHNPEDQMRDSLFADLVAGVILTAENPRAYDPDLAARERLDNAMIRMLGDYRKQARSWGQLVTRVRQAFSRRAPPTFDLNDPNGWIEYYTRKIEDRMNEMDDEIDARPLQRSDDILKRRNDLAAAINKPARTW